MGRKPKPEGFIRHCTNGNILQKRNNEWVYIGCDSELKRKSTKRKLEVIFPPVTLPDHIRPTKYPHYYVSNDGVAYREPRQCDKNGRYGEVNEYGLIQLTTSLRGNPYYGEHFMYEGTNIYLYDENNKNIGYKKINIHQLVAQVWVPNPHGYTEILHLDENPRNNHYANLKWGTHKENMSVKALPEGTKKRIKGVKGSLYEKKDGKWVLIPNTSPAWNKGLKGSSWNTLPEGAVTTRKVNGSPVKFIKQNGKWIYQKKKKTPDGTIRTDKNGRKRIKINGKWVHQRKERVAEVFENGSYVNLKVDGVYPDGTIRIRSDGTKWKKENGKWVYQKKINHT
tara:strand:+ start:165 stop:1178 length:1014 start_codon:yes stop_codon:yes gene_type:complete